MKYDQGLFEKAGKMDPAKTAANVWSKEIQDFSREVAHKALLVVRDDKKLLPVSKDKKILVIEQLIPYPFLGKDLYSHPHMFCEQMTKHSTNLILDDTGFHASDEEVEEALELAKEADLVVMTNYYARIEKRGNNQHLVKALKEGGTHRGRRDQLPVPQRHDHGSRCGDLQLSQARPIRSGRRGSCCSARSSLIRRRRCRST
jgi:hypothetical protein